MGMLSERSLAIADAVKAVAKALGRTSSQVALRWLLQQPGVTSPIIGARKLEHLEDNLGCLEFAIDGDRMRQLDEASAVEMGFPHDFLNSAMVRQVLDGGAVVERREQSA